jgi:hypothetical protein
LRRLRLLFFLPTEAGLQQSWKPKKVQKFLKKLLPTEAGLQQNWKPKEVQKLR